MPFSSTVVPHYNGFTGHCWVVFYNACYLLPNQVSQRPGCWHVACCVFLEEEEDRDGAEGAEGSQQDAAGKSGAARDGEPDAQVSDSAT